MYIKYLVSLLECVGGYEGACLLCLKIVSYEGFGIVLLTMKI